MNLLRLWLAWSWAGLMHAVTVAMSSCVPWPYHAQQIIFCCTCPPTLPLIIFLPISHDDSWTLRGECVVYMSHLEPSPPETRTIVYRKTYMLLFFQHDKGYITWYWLDSYKTKLVFYFIQLTNYLSCPKNYLLNIKVKGECHIWGVDKFIEESPWGFMNSWLMSVFFRTSFILPRAVTDT